MRLFALAQFLWDCGETPQLFAACMFVSASFSGRRSIECRKSLRYPRASQVKECIMFIAMNRFKVRKGSEHDFEQVWLTRQSHLEEVPGFVVFHLLKGPEKDDHVLYASHSEWRSEKHFEAWTRSEAFRKAHASAGSGKPLYLGHTEFEGFTVLQEVKADGTANVAAE
jgi:heme-degrading monooxygenase HmoA